MSQDGMTVDEPSVVAIGTEEDYDNIIAPMLLEVQAKAKELGFHFVARVEWAPGEAGITAYGCGREAGFPQQLAFLAAMARGNLDSLLLHLLKHHDCSGSLVLHRHSREGR